jgi:hypothetical protein
MALQPYSAQDLFEWLTGRESFLLLDVRNDEEFCRWTMPSKFFRVTTWTGKKTNGQLTFTAPWITVLATS